MTTHAAQPVAWAPPCALGESARWHARSWWWVDAAGGVVNRFRPGIDADDVAVPAWLALDERVPVVHPAAGTGVLVVHGAALQFYDFDASGGATPGPLLTVLDLQPGYLLNDGIAGPDGGFYVGVVHPRRERERGFLQQVRPDGTLGDVFRGVGLSNGLAFDPSGMVLYHADSTARTIFAHRLAADGGFAATSEYVLFDADDGMPDGLASDAAGGLWVAMYGSGEARRYAPGGVLDVTVSVPAQQVTSVALGGADGCDLMITTAREGYRDAPGAEEARAGMVFLARSPYRGRPVPRVARHA